MTNASEKAEFEKRFLNLVYSTNTVITAPNVAYQLEMPIEAVQERLLELELNGTIQQKTDNDGGTYYVMPNRPAPGALQRAGGEEGLRTQAAGGGPPGVTNPRDFAAAPIYDNPGARGRNINGLVLNLIVPGVGSLVCGRMIGLAMLGLLLLGLIMFFLPLGFGRLLGVLPIVGAWIWSVIAGIGLLSEKEPAPGTPR